MFTISQKKMEQGVHITPYHYHYFK